MRQTLALAGLLPAGEPSLRPLSEEGGAMIGERDWIEIPAGPFEMGATEDGFAYDNERPRHLAHTEAFAIARLPVSNAAWLHFSDDGGYQRREWWSPEGWAYKQERQLGPHPDIAHGHPDAPVCHISFFEASAFAQAHAARLPSETEWEKAASSSPSVLGAVGQVWEWTSSNFCGYPGFRAYPYREYSEVFFGEAYLVLRGGSWASSPRVASATFRNWDYPQRRQIFAGLRLAKDPA
jgi:iron(II)-dependent oxidoreductase